MASLADIRARLAAQENKSTGNNYPQSDGAIYPHWKMDEGALASMRFLPDADSSNSFFWIERQVIKLPFNGVKGDINSKQVTVQVPCVEMFGENCPVLAEVRPWYKDETLKEMANKYWKKRSYIFQGFVRQNPMGDDTTPANPIRRFVISPQIFQTEAHGLFNLADFLPKKPSEAELRVIKEMFEASVDGRPYDADKFGAYYRPYGVKAPEGTSAPAAESTPAVATTPVATVSETVQPVAETPAPAVETPTQANPSSDKAQDILAMIRARQNND